MGQTMADHNSMSRKTHVAVWCEGSIEWLAVVVGLLGVTRNVRTGVRNEYDAFVFSAWNSPTDGFRFIS